MLWRTSAGSREVTVFVADSSYFVALSDRKDRWHREAQRVKASIRPEFVVSDFVVGEAVTLVGARRGGQPAQVLYEYFVDECEIAFVDRDMLREAIAYHLQYGGRLSVTDCLSLVVMGRRRIGDIVSFDDDFDRVRGINRIH